METNYKIYLICYYNGRPLDFLLPVYTDKQLSSIAETAGTCFKIQDTHNAEIVLACRKNDNINLLRINIESACKANSNISFSIVIKGSEKKAYLHAYTDKEHNAFFPISSDFMNQAQFD